MNGLSGVKYPGGNDPLAEDTGSKVKNIGGKTSGDVLGPSSKSKQVHLPSDNNELDFSLFSKLLSTLAPL
jgi:hypothetical protein